MLSMVAKLPTVVGCLYIVMFAIFSVEKIQQTVRSKNMNFNEKLIELRKSKGLSQDELGNALGVSRQTISKWELAQSYPDFQRLVLLSDYFGQSLDVLVKDIDVQDVREKNLSEKQLSSIYKDVNTAKSTINSVVNILAIIGFSGLALAILAGLLWG